MFFLLLFLCFFGCDPVDDGSGWNKIMAQLSSVTKVWTGLLSTFIMVALCLGGCGCDCVDGGSR